MAVIIHFLESQMTSILNILNKRKWPFKLHTWVQNVSKHSKTSNSDAEYWLVVGGLLMALELLRRQIRQIKGTQIRVIQFNTKYIVYFIILFIVFCRYSTRALLNNLDSTCKFKVGSNVLNKNQKPIMLLMKHILCWFDEGDLIIDATCGTGTMAAST